MESGLVSTIEQFCGHESLGGWEPKEREGWVPADCPMERQWGATGEFRGG